MPSSAHRFLNAQIPERARLRERVEFHVRVALSPETENSRPPPDVCALPADRRITITVGAPPDLIELEPRCGVNLEVPALGDSAWARFELRALRPGSHRLYVSAFDGGTPLGTLTLDVTCDAGIQTGNPAQYSLPIQFRAPEPGDVTLQIRYDRRHQIYRFQLIGLAVGFPEETPSAVLERKPDEEVEELVAQIREFAMAEANYDSRQTRAWLKCRGMDLWDHLIPRDVKRRFWNCADETRRLFILSDNDPFPWEMLYPHAKDATDLGFLAERFQVARYVFDRPPVSRFDFRSATTVLAGEDLDSAREEVDALSSIFQASSVSTGAPLDNLDELLALLDTGQFSLLHFACHNEYRPKAPAASQVWVGAQPFEPLFLGAHRDRFRKSSPLVFMNACRSAGSGLQYTRHTGWARNFLEAGAAAFLGTHWEVRDTSARTFAEEFYRALLKNGKDLGSAVAMAREAIKDEPGDPTWLAYTLYGDPTARAG